MELIDLSCNITTILEEVMVLGFDASVLPHVRLICSVEYKQPWVHFTRTIDEFILYVVKSGELYIQEEGKEYRLKKGDLMFLRPNIMHTGSQASVCNYYYIHFKHPHVRIFHESEAPVQEMLENRRSSLSGDFLSYTGPGNHIAYLPNYYHLKNDVELLHYLKEIKDDYFGVLENFREMVSCRVLELLIRISREYVTTEIEKLSTHTPKVFLKVQRLLSFLNTEYQKKITSCDIEHLFDANYDYLNRVFHKAVGHSIISYLNRVRINRAKELIETTPIKFSEIGYLVGIEDPYYFSKLFKKYTGFTTSQYFKLKSRVSE